MQNFPDDDKHDEMISRQQAYSHLVHESPTIVAEQMLAGKAGLRLADAITWRKWSKMRMACLWQAVALHCQIDPRSMTKASIGYDDDLPSGSAARLYQERISIASQHMFDGALKAKHEPERDMNLWTVRLCDYAQWAKELGMPLPPEFPTSPTSKTKSFESTFKWPWGSHDTALLQLLADAGEKWKTIAEGGNYDPEDPTTAPTNEQIVDWLEKKKVSLNLAKAMATILRADDMPSGRRTSKTK